jgi:hypothetical protein
MKANSLLVLSAVSIALAGVISSKAESLTNPNVYGLSPLGQCILASSSLAPGCTVSSTGNACAVLIYENGVAKSVYAYKSPISAPHCVLTIKRPY